MAQLVTSELSRKNHTSVLWRSIRSRRCRLLLWMAVGVAIPLGWLSWMLFGPRPALRFSERENQLSRVWFDEGDLISRQGASAKTSAGGVGADPIWDLRTWPSDLKVVSFERAAAICLSRRLEAIRDSIEFTDDYYLLRDYEDQVLASPAAVCDSSLASAVVAYNRDWCEWIRTAVKTPVAIKESRLQIKPAFICGHGEEFDGPEVASLVDYARVLQLRVMYWTGRGEFEEVFLDLTAMSNLIQRERFIPKHPRVAISFAYVEGLLYETACSVVLHSEGLPEPLEKLIVDLAQFDRAAALAEEMDHAHRLVALIQLQSQHQEPRVTRQECQSFQEFLQRRFEESRVDWDASLKQHQIFFDHVRDTVRLRQTAGGFQIALADSLNVVGKSSPDQKLTSEFIQTFSQLVPYCRASSELRVRQRMLGVLLEISRYRRQHGEFPDSLADIDWSSWATEVALWQDPHSGANFIYRRTGAGFILYSVGHNGKDDGGVESLDDLPPAYRTANWKNSQTGRSVDDIVYCSDAD